MMDFPFGLGYLFIAPPEEIVSILVMVDFPFGQFGFQLFPLNICVSILVMVDFPFGLHGTINGETVIVEFQSLLWWIFPSDNLTPPQRQQQIIQVSILVMVDFPFGQRRRRVFITGYLSFNPCYGGFSLRTC